MNAMKQVLDEMNDLELASIVKYVLAESIKASQGSTEAGFKTYSLDIHKDPLPEMCVYCDVLVKIDITEEGLPSISFEGVKFYMVKPSFIQVRDGKPRLVRHEMIVPEEYYSQALADFMADLAEKDGDNV
jgi:hypothetical protein